MTKADLRVSFFYGIYCQRGSYKNTGELYEENAGYHALRRLPSPKTSHTYW